MNHRTCVALGLGLFVALSVPAGAGHATGLGNLTYTAAELQVPIATFNGATFVVGPRGSNTAAQVTDFAQQARRAALDQRASVVSNME